MSSDRKYSMSPLTVSQYTRDSYMIEFMMYNKAYLYAKSSSTNDTHENQILYRMIENYKRYRTGWREIPAAAIKTKSGSNFYEIYKMPPMCIDIELASLCDLACPFCFRQHIATPDKLMDVELAYRVIDQAAALGVPSMKFNWRGEPLLHPSLPKVVDYAKKKGIIETIINTNATNLSAKKASELVEAGLDIVIYSFDGGTKDTYNKNRPGRFKPNDFHSVYNNIRQMHSIKQALGAKFPFTRIQMVLTPECYSEQKEFYELFKECVDEVSVGAYMERGAGLDNLNKDEREAVIALSNGGVSSQSSLQYWKDIDGKLYIEDGRLPCEQPFQRLMVSYDGRVFMCCYDWGNEHPVGFVSDRYFSRGDLDYEETYVNAQLGKRGFEMMNLKMPSRHIQPPKVVSTLGEIWDNSELRKIRDCHVNGDIRAIDICSRCTFKETYRWKELIVSK